MAESTRPTTRGHDEIELFTVLLLRYLDGACSADELKQLKSVLAGSASHRELFVSVSRMQGDLYEAYAPRRAARQQKAANVAEPALAAALVGQTAYEAAATTRAAASHDRSSPKWPEHGEVAGGSPLEQEPSAGTPNGAEDTIERELSAEDTAIKPSYKAPEQNPTT
jgi:hypothetical protein